MLPLETLKAARRRLSAQGAWTTETYAKTQKGFDISPCDDAADCWCILGAVYREAGQDPDEYTNHPDVVDAVEKLIAAGGLYSSWAPTPLELIFRWNDQPGRTQDEVLALFDKAIAAEEPVQ